MEPGRRSWADPEPSWGIWGVPESEVRILPDVEGLDTIELGCWHRLRLGLAGPARRPAGRRRHHPGPAGDRAGAAGRARARVPLIEASAEEVPLPDASFDLAISEYGAAIWCDPYRWIPEAARLLRPGGWLVFLGNSTLSTLCSKDDEDPVGEQLVRPHFGGLGRIVWWDGSSVEFCLGHGDMIRLLRASGSTWRTSSSCRRRRGQPPATRTSALSGAGDGPARRSGSPASAPDGRSPTMSATRSPAPSAGSTGSPGSEGVSAHDRPRTSPLGRPHRRPGRPPARHLPVDRRRRRHLPARTCWSALSS